MMRTLGRAVNVAAAACACVVVLALTYPLR